MTRTHRHPVGSFLSRGRLGTHTAARIVCQVAGLPDHGLARLETMDQADIISLAWMRLTGASIHTSEGAVLVVERDRRGRVVRHQIEGVAA